MRLPLSRNMKVLIEPSVTKTLDSLKPYIPEKRGCYFQHERNLYIFKTYSQRNCFTECYIKLIEASCGCVPYYFASMFNRNAYMYGFQIYDIV